jgi:anti-repressor protein
MPDLIPFITRQLGQDTVNTVNARDLHIFLGVTKPYSAWMSYQIKRLHLVENRDYIVYYQDVKNPLGGRPAQEHHLTFDTSKHIAMRSGTPKGHEVREWFIEKEKELTALRQPPQVKNPANQMLIEAIMRLDAVEQQTLEAKKEAEQANANVNRALESQIFFTIAEYVYVNKLQRQVPPPSYRALSDHLRAYCEDHNIPFRRIPVGGKRWESEYGFHISVYTDVLPGWLRRNGGQGNLHMLPPPS